MFLDTLACPQNPQAAGPATPRCLNSRGGGSWGTCGGLWASGLLVSRRDAAMGYAGFAFRRTGHIIVDVNPLEA